jgi:uncharacterized protein with gpF-like domain
MWKAVNRVRNSFAKRILKVWKKALEDALDGDPFAISEAMSATYVEVGGNFARNQFERVARQKAFGVPSDIFEEELALFARDEMATISKSIGDTTFALRAKIIADESLTALEQLEAIDRMIVARANLVTQNEIVRASNVGIEIGAAKAAAIENRRIVKTWIATIDDRVRDSHDNADGQTVRGNEKFIVGIASLAYPKDPSGPVEETINCRCVLDYQKIADS